MAVGANWGPETPCPCRGGAPLIISGRLGWFSGLRLSTCGWLAGDGPRTTVSPCIARACRSRQRCNFSARTNAPHGSLSLNATKMVSGRSEYSVSLVRINSLSNGRWRRQASQMGKRGSRIEEVYLPMFYTISALDIGTAVIVWESVLLLAQ